MSQTGDSREHIRAWIDFERRTYADLKYGEGTVGDDALRHDVATNPTMDTTPANVDIDLFVGNYMSRVRLMGLATPNGRQAMGKLIVTLIDHLERAVDVYGPMPAPGVSSGTILEWQGDTHV